MKTLKRILLVLALIGVLVWVFFDQLLNVIQDAGQSVAEELPHI